jgi:hypothetical protein
MFAFKLKCKMDHLDINKLNDKYRNSSPTEIIQSALDFSTNIILISTGIAPNYQRKR